MVCRGLHRVPSSFPQALSTTQGPPGAQGSTHGQARPPVPPVSPGPLENLSVIRLLTWAQKQSTEACFELYDEFHKQVLVLSLQGGFLCFDSFKPFSISCQAQCLIETHVCFLDIFVLLEFPLPSVYFLLQTLLITVLSHRHTHRKPPSLKKPALHGTKPGGSMVAVLFGAVSGLLASGGSLGIWVPRPVREEM